MQRRVHYSPRSPRRVPWWRVVIGLGVAVLLLLSFLGGAAWFLNREEGSTASPTATTGAPLGENSDDNSGVKKKILEDTSTTDDPQIPDWPETEAFSVVIIGVDTRANDVGRADTIIVVTVDPEKKAAMLVSIPRDVVSMVPGYQNLRINELFGYGGADLVMESAEILLGIPIQYYLTIDFDGFRRIIDELGGVEIDVKSDINDYSFPNEDDTGFDPFIIKSGVHHMDGDTLLRYVRTRFDDPRGDFGRIDRQQQAVVALKQLLTFQSLVKAPRLVDELHAMVDTNLPIASHRVVGLARLGLAIPLERVYSEVIDYEGNLVKDDELESGAKVLRPNLPAVRSMMQESLAAMGQLQPLAGQEATVQQADVEP